MSIIGNIKERIRASWGDRIEEKAKAPVKMSGMAGVFGSNDVFGISVGHALKIDDDLMTRYADYEDMDNYSTIAAAYNVLADDCTITDYIENKTVMVEAESKRSEFILEDMFNRIKIDENIWEIVRTALKYGNDFEYIDIGENGIKGIVYLPPVIMRRAEKEGDTAFYCDFSGTASPSNAEQVFKKIKDQQEGKDVRLNGVDAGAYTGQMNAVFEGWQVVHWRNRSSNRGAFYGYSYGEPARWCWKRLVLMEDATLLFRLTKAPSRYVYYLDTGALPPTEALAYIEKVKQKLKRTKFINPRNGKIDLRFNPMPIAFNTSIPLIDGRNITIESLAKEWDDGKDNFVYAVDRNSKNRISQGKVLWCGKSDGSGKAIKVVYSDDSYNIVDPIHPFILSDGSEVVAGSLKANDLLMGYNTTLDEIACEQKVKRIEVVENCDMYCMNVQGLHNFAMLSVGSDGDVNKDSGVFVKNSESDDIYLPVREGKDRTRVEALAGPDYNSIDDIEYFQSKLFSALAIPKSYLGYDELIGSRYSLASEDVRYARTVMRLQQMMKGGLRQLCNVELAANNISPKSAGYTVYLPAPTKVMETAYIELMQLRVQLANEMQEMFSRQWIMEHILKLTPSEINEIVGQKDKETLDQSDVENEIMEKQMETQYKTDKKYGVDSSTIGSGGSEGEKKGPRVRRESYSRKNGKLLFSDKEFTEGSLRKEREMSGKIDGILESNKKLSKRVENLRNLMVDMAKNNMSSKRFVD